MANAPKGSNANIMLAFKRLGSAMEAQRAEATHLAWCSALLALRDARQIGGEISISAISTTLASRFPGKVKITTKNFKEYVKEAECVHSQCGARRSSRLNQMVEAICNA